KGQYVVSDNGALFVNGNVAVGDGLAAGQTGLGTFIINGGSATVSGTLKVMNYYLDNVIELDAGTLTVGQLDLLLNPSCFGWYGGVLRITSTVTEIGPYSSLGPFLSLAGGHGLIADMGVTIDGGANLVLQGGSLSASN